MRCKEYFRDDRICDICKACQIKVYEQCKMAYNAKIKRSKRLVKIEKNCKYVTEEWDDYTKYYGCSNPKMDNMDECNPSEECLK